MHEPPQEIWPEVGHAQVPPWQAKPAPQAVPAWVPVQFPAAPQWVKLARGSMHAPPQEIWPEVGHAQVPS
jgi:hypothetical protein